MVVFDFMQPQQWQDVNNIYEDGIATGNATFQQSAPKWEEWNKNLLPACRIIAKEEDTILAWAA